MSVVGVCGEGGGQVVYGVYAGVYGGCLPNTAGRGGGQASRCRGPGRLRPGPGGACAHGTACVRMGGMRSALHAPPGRARTGNHAWPSLLDRFPTPTLCASPMPSCQGKQTRCACLIAWFVTLTIAMRSKFAMASACGWLLPWLLARPYTEWLLRYMHFAKRCNPSMQQPIHAATHPCRNQVITNYPCRNGHHGAGNLAQPNPQLPQRWCQRHAYHAC